MFDDLEVVNALAEKALLGFFNDSVSSLGEINQQCKTFEDVKKLLKPISDKQIIFNGFDDFKIDLNERFAKQKDYQAEHGYSDIFNEASNFTFALFSHILKANSVIEICTKFCLTPYLRYDVIFHYFTLILESVLAMDKCAEMKILLSKTQAAYITGKVINRDLFVDIDFNTFYKFCREFNFESKLADKRQELNEHSDNISLVSAVNGVLTDFYDFCGIIKSVN